MPRICKCGKKIEPAYRDVGACEDCFAEKMADPHTLIRMANPATPLPPSKDYRPHHSRYFRGRRH